MIQVTNEVTSCEVCGNDDLLTALDLGLHPMCDDLVRLGDERACSEYPIEILFCELCFTAHQRYQVPKNQLFPASYHYRSRFTGDVLSGMNHLVESCERRFGSLAGKKVLDVGCNDGSLLDAFRLKGAATYGIEPTDAYLDASSRGHTIFNSFLSEDVSDRIAALHGKPDFITFTNVFAHIENLQEVLNSVKRLMTQDCVIIIENHYLGSVLDNNQFDTFYHEHPRTYSQSSFMKIASSLGVQLLDVEFPSRYGGNIRVFLGRQPVGDRKEIPDWMKRSIREQRFLGDFAILRARIDSWIAIKGEFLRSHVVKHGKLRAKAFPGRAAILIKLLGLTENHIAAVYEKPGSLKIGHYVPGTRIPILSDETLFALPDKSRPLLNLAWHIPQEIKSYLTANNYIGPVIDILSADDFPH